VLLVALITVVPLGAQLIRSGAAQSSADRPAPRAVAAVTPAPPPSAADVLERTVDGWEAESGGRLSLAVADLETGATARDGEQRHGLATASIVKVDILATLLLQRDGELSRAQKALAERMIEDSDNSAASALWRQIGRARGLAAANKRFGLTSTVGGSGGWWGRTTTTPADQLRLLHVIFTDESPLPAPSRAYVRALMG